MGTETTLIIVFTLAIGTLVTILLLPIFSLPFVIRSLRFYFLAKKFGLNFHANYKLYILTPHHFKKNVLSGNLNGHDVEIYDVYAMQKSDASFILSRNRFVLTDHYSRVTNVIIDGNINVIKGKLFPFAPIKTIREIIGSL